MYAFGVLTTLLRAPRRRAYNLSHDKSLPRISRSWHRSLSGPQRTLSWSPPAESVKIIIRHAPRFARRDPHRAVATPEKIFRCCQRAPLSVPARGSTLQRDRLGDGQQPIRARPTMRKVVLKGSFGQCFHYFCFNLPPAAPSAWQPNPGRSSTYRCGKCQTPRPTLYRCTEACREWARTELRWTRSARSMLRPISASAW